MSAEQCQVSRRNDRLKNQKDFFGALVIFTVTDFKFWRTCLENMSVGMVSLGSYGVLLGSVWNFLLRFQSDKFLGSGQGSLVKFWGGSPENFHEVSGAKQTPQHSIVTSLGVPNHLTLMRVFTRGRLTVVWMLSPRQRVESTYWTQLDVPMCHARASGDKSVLAPGGIILGSFSSLFCTSITRCPFKSGPCGVSQIEPHVQTSQPC